MKNSAHKSKFGHDQPDWARHEDWAPQLDCRRTNSVGEWEAYYYWLLLLEWSDSKNTWWKCRQVRKYKNGSRWMKAMSYWVWGEGHEAIWAVHDTEVDLLAICHRVLPRPWPRYLVIQLYVLLVAPDKRRKLLLCYRARLLYQSLGWVVSILENSYTCYYLLIVDHNSINYSTELVL